MIATILLAGTCLFMCLAVYILDADRDHLAGVLRQQRAELDALRRRVLAPGDTPLHDVARMHVYGPSDPEGGAA